MEKPLIFLIILGAWVVIYFAAGLLFLLIDPVYSPKENLSAIEIVYAWPLFTAIAVLFGLIQYAFIFLLVIGAFFGSAIIIYKKLSD